MQVFLYEVSNVMRWWPELQTDGWQESGPGGGKFSAEFSPDGRYQRSRGRRSCGAVVAGARSIFEEACAIG